MRTVRTKKSEVLTIYNFLPRVRVTQAHPRFSKLQFRDIRPKMD